MTPGQDRPGSVAESLWVARIREGDVAALEALYHAYHSRLCGYAQGHVLVPEVAEDIVEDLFVRIWERREEWDLRGSVRGYLYGAVRKAALLHLRNRRIRDGIHRTLTSAGRSPGSSESLPSPDDEVQVKELEAILRSTIDGLPARPREAFLLARQHDFSYAAIAKMMGISVSTVEKHMARANSELREALAAWSRDVPFRS